MAEQGLAVRINKSVPDNAIHVSENNRWRAYIIGCRRRRDGITPFIPSYLQPINIRIERRTCAIIRIQKPAVLMASSAAKTQTANNSATFSKALSPRPVRIRSSTSSRRSLCLVSVRYAELTTTYLGPETLSTSFVRKSMRC